MRDALAEIDEEIANAFAARIAAKLRDEHVIPGEIPADVGEQIADHARAGAVYWMQSIPLRGAHSIGAYYTLTPAGRLHVELRRSNGETFWRGTLAPAGPR